MATPNQQSEQHIGETKAVPNNVHDLVHDLSNRIDALWRYDQYMANAEAAGNKEEKKLWSDLRKAEIKTTDKLKSLLYTALGKSMNEEGANSEMKG